jgi:hypothetical protein
MTLRMLGRVDSREAELDKGIQTDYSAGRGKGDR